MGLSVVYGKVKSSLTALLLPTKSNWVAAAVDVVDAVVVVFVVDKGVSRLVWSWCSRKGEEEELSLVAAAVAIGLLLTTCREEDADIDKSTAAVDNFAKKMS